MKTEQCRLVCVYVLLGTEHRTSALPLRYVSSLAMLDFERCSQRNTDSTESDCLHPYSPEFSDLVLNLVGLSQGLFSGCAESTEWRARQHGFHCQLTSPLWTSVSLKRKEAFLCLVV